MEQPSNWLTRYWKELVLIAGIGQARYIIFLWCLAILAFIGLLIQIVYTAINYYS